ncbi:MAG TPA: hypothetical protein VL133_12655, partial [Devosia sp.]|nr:hypothetical protein [Devosia sp.]
MTSLAAIGSVGIFTVRPTKFLAARLLLSCAALVLPLLANAPVLAQALPNGGSVTAGSVVIDAPSGGNLLITQSSQYGILNWDSFS